MNSKIPLYFVPGLAASSKIFEFLRFDETKYEVYKLEWLLPLSDKETIQNYAKRMAALVRHDNPVLIGVSFGGIMVQEMSKHLQAHCIFLVSSIKTNKELPKRLKVIQKTRAYKLFPTKAVQNLDQFSTFMFGSFIQKRIKLYENYMTMKDEKYLTWAIYNVLHWQQTNPLPNTIQIHGTEDYVFPIKHIENPIKIKGGTHIMILNKAKTICSIIDAQLSLV
ncbi:MAG: alpha/beta hydrolase [Flavobacteriaceae bacterium]|nr:MAG: alpha/beta hydrolase [Flavobacteriaceae bacterium]